MATLEFDGVSKTFGNGVHAVRDLSLTASTGEFLVLVGPSGCGKTTALRMLAGLEQITAGEIRIGGARVNETPDREGGGDPRPLRAAGAQAESALGRSAPARRDGPRDRARAPGVPHGRAPV